MHGNGAEHDTSRHELGRIERAHGRWAGNPNVLYIRPTERSEQVWHAATTFEALDAMLGG